MSLIHKSVQLSASGIMQTGGNWGGVRCVHWSAKWSFESNKEKYRNMNAKASIHNQICPTELKMTHQIQAWLMLLSKANSGPTNTHVSAQF
jgi:hypothetical protein